MAFHHMLGWSMPCWAATACQRQGMIVVVSVVELAELVAPHLQRGLLLHKAPRHHRLPSTASQTLGHQDLTPCRIPITQTEKNSLSIEVTEIATSIHPPRPTLRRPRTRHRLTHLKILVIPIETPSLVIIPTPAPCRMVTAQQDSTILQVGVVASVVCLSAAGPAAVQGRQRMTALPPR